jgi:hypothetical protein
MSGGVYFAVDWQIKHHNNNRKALAARAKVQ